MSYNETKLAIRLEIKQLQGKSDHEAYLYFKEVFKREPNDIDYHDHYDDNKIVNYFYYDSSEYDIVRDENGKWGIDYNLHCGEEHEYAIINVFEIDDIVDNICEIFNVGRHECKLVSYVWYNGADEPIVFG